MVKWMADEPGSAPGSLQTGNAVQQKGNAMKNLISWMVAVMSCMSLDFAMAQADKDFTATVTKRDKAAVIDGVAGEGEYPAAALTIKQSPYGMDINGLPASAKVCHDGKTLYVTITVPLKDGSNLSKGEAWAQDDAAEVCFCDASNAQVGPTFIIHGFASGKHESTTDGGATDDAAEKLGKAVKYAAKTGNQSWTGEWAIPFEAAGLKYKPGMKLGFNLGAWRTEDGEWIIWRGTQGPTHQLENGGKLTLE